MGSVGNGAVMKRFLKSLSNFTAFLAVWPVVAIYRSMACCLGTERVFPGWSQAFSLIPGTSGRYLRHAFYRRVLARCGDDAWISFGTLFSHATASIGRNVYIGANCSLGDVTLEDDVLVASNVSIMNGSQQHGIDRLDIPIREQPGVYRHVKIGCDSWIGERAVVAADVGRHCVIGAGAVVTRPVPDYAVALGVPARVVKFRNAADQSALCNPAERSLQPA